MRIKILQYLGLFFLTVASATADQEESFKLINTIDELHEYSSQDHVKVKMKPGLYQIQDATSHHFIRITGNDSHYDLNGVTFEIDNQLFSKFGVVPGRDGFYCVISVTGNRVMLEGLTTVNKGDVYGIQSRNKIFNIVGEDVVLRNVDVTTSGSRPWGYGSLYGLGGPVVRKMNGVRVGWPAKGVKLIGCRVHMRAMGHAIFIQGATDTLIENCHVDGLLRPTNEILAETSGYAFEQGFKAKSPDYVEGVVVGAQREILPNEIISLSEDGIRMYPYGGDKQPTGSTTIRNCTVRQMRRGICTGLSVAPDLVVDCEVSDCVAAGFNIGNRDVLQNCRADARYAEALSCPYDGSRDASVELDISDSRGGLKNRLLATINGKGHHISLTTENPEFVPAEFMIERATRNGYAFYQKKNENPVSRNITLKNETSAEVVGP